MATRSTVSIEHADGTVQVIYVHSDGYLEGVGAALKAHHNNREAIQTLIDMGDHSRIFGNETLSYKEWRNENCPAGKYNSYINAMRFQSQVYNYLFTKEDELKCFNENGFVIDRF